MSAHGIVGRGVLLDFASWASSRSPPRQYDPFSTSSVISHADLLAVAAHQGTPINHGDILFIRTGFIAAFTALSPSQQQSLASTSPPQAGGVQRSKDFLEWAWENFSAVAGDQPSFENWPAEKGELMLHEVLLAGWGCPIGELFDLEALAEECVRQGRWSFFLTSEVCNVPGGVASPPNALAIF